MTQRHNRENASWYSNSKTEPEEARRGLPLQPAPLPVLVADQVDQGALACGVVARLLLLSVSQGDKCLLRSWVRCRSLVQLNVEVG